MDQLVLTFSQSGTLWMLLHLPSMVFVFCFGACVGSFTNVVIYRLPAGMSVITPPSRCPVCGARLRFFRENLPILGWFIIGGKCRYCRAPVSPQYMIVELLMALLFLGLYLLLFTTGSGNSWWAEIGGPWWSVNTFLRAWPAFIALAFMLAALVAMTVIDARTFMIPLQIPLFVTLTAFIAYPLQELLPHFSPTAQTCPHYCPSWPWLLAAFGGMSGVLLSTMLLAAGKLRYSFADYAQYVEDGEALGDYPHARREMGVELLFLLPAVIGAIVGYIIGGRVSAGIAPPQFIQVIGTVCLGYLTGGALIWGTRMLGTLAFGREAMGLGDVHLLAAIGAVLGWFPSILIFFLAPFSGLFWAMLSIGSSSLLRTTRRELPYGPHLAVATVVVMLCGPGIAQVWQTHFPPTLSMPRPGFYQPPQPPQSPQSAPTGPSSERDGSASLASPRPW